MRKVRQEIKALKVRAPAGALIEQFGYVQFYLLTTVAAVPGIRLFLWMMRNGLVDRVLEARHAPSQSA